jgi:hypothetical protein
MNRVLPLAVAAATAMILGACSSPEPPQDSAAPAAMATPTPAPPAAPIAVHVALPESPDPAVLAWGQALATAITSGQGGLTLVAPPEEAAAAVRIDSVRTGVEWEPAPPGEGKISVMHGALVLGDSAREFDFAYRGDVAPQAEILARNLRAFAAESGEKPTTAPEEAETGPEEPEAETGDEG